MKKLALVMLALFLVIPALGNAGSVSSRYDVTFGGFVKLDVGWSSQAANADPALASRSSGNNYSVFNDEFSNTFMTGGETRMNFLVKGPDLWGAKTSAFIEGDFRGVSTGNQYGGFQLRHAFMKLTWPGKTELMMGQNWQQWGMPYYGAWLGVNDFRAELRGQRLPQMAIRYFFNKEFNAMFGISAATEWSGTGGIRQVDTYSESNWPGLMAEIAYWSDRCGKIGSNNLKFGLGGYYGQERPSAVDAANVSTYYSDRLNVWLAALRYSVPIIPEKQGNKAMALLLNGNFFIGQNVAENYWMGTGGTSLGSYQRPNANGDFAAPTLFGLFTQASWWLTDSLSVNGMYGYLRYNYSEWARTNNAVGRNRLSMQQTYAVSLLWDANQAVRFGLQWLTEFTQYGGKNATGGIGTGVAEGNGSIDQYRFAAWYFF